MHALHYAHSVLATGEAEVDMTRLGGAIRLGGFQTLVHGHDLDKEVLIQLPPLMLQSRFGRIASKVQSLRMGLTTPKQAGVFNSLVQRAFRGEL